PTPAHEDRRTRGGRCAATASEGSPSENTILKSSLRRDRGKWGRSTSRPVTPSSLPGGIERCPAGRQATHRGAHERLRPRLAVQILDQADLIQTVIQALVQALEQTFHEALR
ncbi:MAG: hypothetical protein ACO3ZY_06555, partial [Phycisphaerales bacterium]